MGACTLCQHSKDLKAIENENHIQSVAFLKNCSVTELRIQDPLCDFCYENVEAVLTIRETYSFKFDSNDEGEVVESFTGNSTHICILCDDSFDLCSDVQSHLIRFHTAAEFAQTREEDDPDFPRDVLNGGDLKSEESFPIDSLSELDLDSTCQDLLNDPLNTGRDQMEADDVMVKNTDMTDILSSNDDDIIDQADNDFIEAMDKGDAESQQEALSQENDPKSSATVGKTSKRKYKKRTRKEVQNVCFKCNKCEKYFFGKHVSKSHINYTSCKGTSTSKYYFCCQKFLSEEEYHQHLSQNTAKNNQDVSHDVKDLTCPHCQKSFTKLADLLRCWNRRPTRKKKKRNACPHCFVVLRCPKKDLNAHIERRHPEVLYGNKCPKCCKEVDNLLDHMKRIHYGQQENKLKCNDCDLLLKNETTLKAHWKNNHSKGQTMCEVCGKTWANKSSLKTHMEAHCEEKKFQCKTCGKFLKSESSLRKHNKHVHSDVKFWKCQTCHQKFESSSDLKTHLKVVHNNIKKFQCQECSWSFNHRGAFNEHVKQVHRRIKKFKCDICQQQFGHGSTLTKHKRVHLKRDELNPHT